MIGRVVLLHAMLDVPFLLSDSSQIEAPFVVDTGFTGQLTLPVQDVETLQLELIGTKRALLADNTAFNYPVYRADILWNGIKKSVVVMAMGERPLLGTGLLEGHTLKIHFVENGTVLIEPL